MKASIVDQFNRQLIRTKRDSKSDPEAKPFPSAEAKADPEAKPEADPEADPEAEPNAEALAVADPDPKPEAGPEAEGDPRQSIHDLSIEELQDLLHSINGKKLLKTSSSTPSRLPLGDHVLDLSRFQGASHLVKPSQGLINGIHGINTNINHHHSHTGSQKVVLGGDFLTDPLLRQKLSLNSVTRKNVPVPSKFNSVPVEAVKLLGQEPISSVFSLQNSDPMSEEFFRAQLSKQSNLAKPQNILSSSNQRPGGTMNSLRDGDMTSQSGQSNVESLGQNLKTGKQTNFLTDQEVMNLLRKSPEQSFTLSSSFSGLDNAGQGLGGQRTTRLLPSDQSLDAIFADTVRAREERQQLDRRQTPAPLAEPVNPGSTLGGTLTASQLTDDIVARVMEHLKHNKPGFQLPGDPSPPFPPPPPPPVPSLLPGQLGGVVVPPHDPLLINDHFPLPHNPLPPHHENRHHAGHNVHLPSHHGSHHQAIQDILHEHKAHHHLDHLDYDPHVELHVKPNPPKPHYDHPPHPEPVITKTEVEAPPGCKAYSTKTCKKIPKVHSEKVPVPKCYDVPKVT